MYTCVTFIERFPWNLRLDTWNRFLLEKLGVPQLLKKFSLLWNPKVHYHFHNTFTNGQYNERQ